MEKQTILRKFVSENNVNITHLATEAGVTRQVIHQWLTGAAASRRNADKMCNILGGYLRVEHFMMPDKFLIVKNKLTPRRKQ